ncbi:hypothetical protein VO54_03888 [Elizabethkingia miricola]|nr:hypothetical protein VO54_03888 [Elizabethkingia miricola]
MKKLDLLQMENLQGGKHAMCTSRNDKIMAWAGAAALGASFIPIAGWAIATPTAVGGVVYAFVCAYS